MVLQFNPSVLTNDLPDLCVQRVTGSRYGTKCIQYVDARSYNYHDRMCWLTISIYEPLEKRHDAHESALDDNQKLMALEN